MITEKCVRSWHKAALLAGAVSISLVAAQTGANAQSPPPGAPQGAPPGLPSLAGGPPGAPPPGGPGVASHPDPASVGPDIASGLIPIPHGPDLTPAQKIVAALPTPSPGAGSFEQPLAPDAPMPSADPRDLQGTWFHNQSLEYRAQKDMYGNAAPYNMEGAKIISRRVMSTANGKPYINASTICRLPGPQWQHDLNMPFQIMQSKTAIEFVFSEYRGRWNITLDPKKAPLPPGRAYMGRSVGHWIGDTLVVETTGFKQPLWLDVDGTPLTADGKLITRIRKVDYGDRHPYLEMITTIIDPTYYTQPWSIVRTFGWDPTKVRFNEYNCEEQVGDPMGSPDAGLIPEPKD